MSSVFYTTRSKRQLTGYEATCLKQRNYFCATKHNYFVELTAKASKNYGQVQRGDKQIHRSPLLTIKGKLNASETLIGTRCIQDRKRWYAQPELVLFP